MTPPRLARRLIGLLVRDEDRELFLGDVDEGYERERRRAGAAVAGRWYWRQVGASLVPLLRHRLPARRSMNTHDTSRRHRLMWQTLINDVRYAGRLARRNVSTSVVIATTVALGIGATTAVFGIVDAVLIRPLPFPASDRVVTIEGVVGHDRYIGNVAYPDLVDFRNGVAAFSDASAFQLTEETLEHGSDPQMLRCVNVDDAFQRIFSLRPALGRLLEKNDFQLGGAPVVVLSNALWQREFGGDRNIVGSTIRLSGRSVQVVGVLEPTEFSYPRSELDALTPLIPQPGTMMVNRGAMWASAVAMLRPGATLEQARRQLAAVAARIEKDYPKSNTGITARALSLKEDVIGDVRTMLTLLSLAMIAVLVIACANVANLTIGQAVARTREFAVRAALGGSANRIARQVLVEAIVVVAIGGMIGVLLAPLLTHVFVVLYPVGLPRANEIHLSYRTLTVAFASVMLASLLAAWPTIRHATRSLGDSLRGGTKGSRRSSGGGLLIASQVATALALIFASTLLGQTFLRLMRTAPGFEPHGVASFRVRVPYVRYGDRAKIDGYYDALTASIRSLPGVNAVSTATSIPFGQITFRDVFVQNEVGDQGPRNPQVPINIITTGFERALGVPLVAGRSFTREDDSSSVKVVMVNRALADRYYAGNAVGKIINWNGENWEIVGTVGSTVLDRLDSPMEPMLFIPEPQAPRTTRFVVVRSSRNPADLLVEIRARMRQIDPTIAMTSIATMDDRLAESLASQRFRAVLVGGLCLLAVVLSVVGIYGVVSYAVAGRTREIGIRMALGESASRVRRLVLASALRTATIGAVAGVGVAVMASRWLAQFEVGTTGVNLPALLLATVLALGIVAASAFLPARRASRVDPVEALRIE
jgi:putative ABC transport system permease protein